MTDNLIILTVLVHLLTAVVLIFFWQKVTIHRIISVVGSAFGLLVSIRLFKATWDSGILTMQAGNWKAPFGITFVSDGFSSTMVLLTAIAGLAISLFSTMGVSQSRIKYGYFVIFHFLLMGLNGAFLTGDIFNLYVWFEVIIISSFVLMTLGGRKTQIEGAIKYVAMNLLASVIFLTAIGILYGLTGTLNMADLSLKVALVENRELVNITALFFFVGFGIKSAVFPLYFWLPSSYHTPPSAIAAAFGGLLTKVGIYALLRVFTLIFVPDEFTRNMLIAVAVATLLTGAFGAIIKHDIRKMFSYLIVCHIGFMIAGLGLYTEIALTGAVFYLIHDIIVKTNLFLMTGIIYKIRGTVNMEKLGGLYTAYPRMSLVMALVLFSLVGVPPLSGFWPKIFLFQAGIAKESYWLIASLVFASFVTLFVIARMWSEVFWKNLPEGQVHVDGLKGMRRLQRGVLVAPVVLMAGVSLLIGLGAEKVIVVARHIAVEMMDTGPYIQAVLHPLATQ
jgi:multicomponent Na+:H+ antiporter subunit D